MSGYASFTEVGFPIIATVFFFIGIFFAVSAYGLVNLAMVSKVKLAQAVFTLVSAVFLVWGPSPMRSLAIHLYILALASFFTDKSKVASTFVLIFTVVTFLCLTGTGWLFGYGSMIHQVSNAQCANYFGIAMDSSRCDGYLMFLRVISVFATMLTGSLMLNVLFNSNKK